MELTIPGLPPLAWTLDGKLGHIPEDARLMRLDQLLAAQESIEMDQDMSPDHTSRG